MIPCRSAVRMSCQPRRDHPLPAAAAEREIELWQLDFFAGHEALQVGLEAGSVQRAEAFEVVRAMLLLRANSLAASGWRPSTRRCWAPSA